MTHKIEVANRILELLDIMKANSGDPLKRFEARDELDALMFDNAGLIAVALMNSKEEGT